MKSMSDVIGDLFLCEQGTPIKYSINDAEYEAGFELLKGGLTQIAVNMMLNPVEEIKTLSCFAGILLEAGFRLGYERGCENTNMVWSGVVGPEGLPKYDWMKENN